MIKGRRNFEKRCDDGSQCNSWGIVSYNCNEFGGEVESKYGIKE